MTQDQTNGTIYLPCKIKSFKHDGSLHRVWQDNWRVPPALLDSEHAAESMEVLLNDHTPVREADGSEWISKVPAAAFFLPGEWFNVVALLENGGIRYYCNIASPFMLYDDVLTYIDYDLDVVLLPDGSRQELDRNEYERHSLEYRYDDNVARQIEIGLRRLYERMDQGAAPFREEPVRKYLEEWKNRQNKR